jgi:hypothetical protein
VVWGLLVIGVIVTLIAYAIIQETRAQRHWRGLASAGNVDAIRQMLENETQRWSTQSVPKEVPASLWHGVQTIELVEVGGDFVHVSCSAEGSFHGKTVVGSGRQEVSSPLQEGMKLTRKLADMLLYDIPNLRLARAQIDVYTTFREESGVASQRCILSTIIDRSRVQEIDWDAVSEEEFVRHFGGRFSTDSRGGAHSIDPTEGALRKEASSPQPSPGRTV